MDFTDKVKEELENRVSQIEDFINERGLGSEKLQKAKKVQRNVNLGIFLGGAVVIAGLTAWWLNRDDE